MGERILLYGATRGTGALIAERLLARGYALRILVRDPEHTLAFSGTVEIVRGDLTRPETLVGATRRVEQVIFTAGVTQRPANEALIKAVEYDSEQRPSLYYRTCRHPRRRARRQPASDAFAGGSAAHSGNPHRAG